MRKAHAPPTTISRQEGSAGGIWPHDRAGWRASQPRFWLHRALLEVDDQSCVGTRGVDISTSGQASKTLIHVTVQGAPMTFSRGWNPPGGRAEPLSSQPCWGLSCKRALEWKTRAEGQPRALREQVAEAWGPWKEGQSCPRRGGHSSPGPEGPGRGRSEDMAISSGYSRGAHSF